MKIASTCLFSALFCLGCYHLVLDGGETDDTGGDTGSDSETEADSDSESDTCTLDPCVDEITQEAIEHCMESCGAWAGDCPDLDILYCLEPQDTLVDDVGGLCFPKAVLHCEDVVECLCLPYPLWMCGTESMKRECRGRECRVVCLDD